MIEFRPLQHEIIDNVLKRNDTLVIMPTGGGKSICYQIPALIFQGVTIVVSPLISLMKDQVEQLSALGVGAVFLNSSLSYPEYHHNVARIMRHEAKLLYVAPETLLMQKTLALPDSQQVIVSRLTRPTVFRNGDMTFVPNTASLWKSENPFPRGGMHGIDGDSDSPRTNRTSKPR